MDSTHVLLPCQISKSLLSHCSILNQTCFQELHTKMSVSPPPPPPHQHSSPNIPLLCLCNKVTEHSLGVIFTKPYQTTITSSKHLLPELVPCALFKSTMNSYHVLPCQISNALLFHFSILNQNFEPELYTIVGLTTTTSTFMSKNPLLSVSLQQVTKTIAESNLHQPHQTT